MWEGESSERCSMSTCANGMKCRVVEWVNRNTLKWFGHAERMGSGKFAKVCESEAEGLNMKGRPLGRWKNRVKENLSKRSCISGRGVLEQARISKFTMHSLLHKLCSQFEFSNDIRQNFKSIRASVSNSD